MSGSWAHTPSLASAIAQFGDFDVHLVQSTHEPSFWIEVYSHSSASTLECYGFDQLDDDELARIIDFIALMRRQFPDPD
jgi:hypothetical protein